MAFCTFDRRSESERCRVRNSRNLDHMDGLICIGGTGTAVWRSDFFSLDFEGPTFQFNRFNEYAPTGVRVLTACHNQNLASAKVNGWHRRFWSEGYDFLPSCDPTLR
jgi:hypothetical protein